MICNKLEYKCVEKGVPQYEKESGSSITFLIFYSCDEHERFFNI